MRRRRYLLTVVLLLAALLAGYLGIRFYPVWKAAKYLEENQILAHFAYELELELDREALPPESDRMFSVLTKLTGFAEDSMCRPVVRGEVCGDIIHASAYPEEAERPLIELYLGDDIDVINETLFYNAVQSHLTDRYALLGAVLPEQKEELYMTLEQVEQLFGLDLRKVRDFRLETINDRNVAGKYFLMLAAMSREEGDGVSIFSLETDQATLRFEIPREGSAASLAVRLQIQEPAAFAGDAAKFLSGLGIGEFPEAEQLAALKSLSVTLTPGGENIAMPTDFVNQNVIELISRIREWAEKLINGGEEEPDYC